jgi:hypothetical protein
MIELEVLNCVFIDDRNKQNHFERELSVESESTLASKMFII